MAVTLHAPTSDDADGIARLSAQLGYACAVDTVRDRLRGYVAEDDQTITLAVDDERIVGFVEVRLAKTLESGTWAEIVGLVVDRAHRRRGVGRVLVDWAQAWAANLGLDHLRVRTNVTRDDARAFYTDLGFDEIKQQRVMVQQIERC